MAKKRGSVGAWIFGIQPDFRVGFIFVTDAGTSGSYLHEASYKTAMTDLVEIPSHLIGTEFANGIKADLQKRADEMREQAKR